MTDKQNIIEARSSGVLVDNDGKRIGLSLDVVGDTPTIVTFSAEDAADLLPALIHGLGVAAQRQAQDQNLKRVLTPEWWEINPHPNSDGLLFSFRLPGGMEMTFHLHGQAVSGFEEVLRNLTGSGTIPSYQGPKN